MECDAEGCATRPLKASRWHWRRVLLLSLVCVTGIGLLSVYKVLPKPDKQLTSRPPDPAPKAAAETLSEMFNNDFPGTSYWSFPKNYLQADKSNFLITVNLYLDRSASAKFIAVYVPRSKYSYVTSLAFARDVYSTISDIERRFNVTQHTPGQAGVVSENDLVFSKRIFLYAEDDFSAEQMGNLTRFYKDKAFDLQIRSNDYVMLRNYQRANR
jgi:hypothetical protein